MGVLIYSMKKVNDRSFHKRFIEIINHSIFSVDILKGSNDIQIRNISWVSFCIKTRFDEVFLKSPNQTFVTSMMFSFIGFFVKNSFYQKYYV